MIITLYESKLDQPNHTCEFLDSIVESECRQGIISEISKKRCITQSNPSKYLDPYNFRNIKGDKSTTLRSNNTNGNIWIRIE